jgi:hypothetical protein
MAKVNLWELITTVADKDLSNSDRCHEIKSMLGPRFGTELSLEITERGTWVVEIFDHEDHEHKVTLVIEPNGDLNVTRCRRTGDIFETRTVGF